MAAGREKREAVIPFPFSTSKEMEEKAISDRDDGTDGSRFLVSNG